MNGDQTKRHVLIVGASAAGVSTALTLRDEGFAGPITLLGAEEHLPYDRPPLSKQVLMGEMDYDNITLSSADELAERDIEIRLGQTATGLDEAQRQVLLASGHRVAYDELVIATGTSARQLPAAVGIGGVFTLKTLEDAIGLKQRLQAGKRLVLVGAGFIGLEVAAAAIGLGLQVDVVEPEEVPLGNRLTNEVGRWLVEEHKARGVTFHLGQVVSKFHTERDEICGVELANGIIVPADAVLVGIGTVPNTGWLKGSTIDIDNGVLTDEFGQAAPGIYAVGDVAKSFHPGLGRHHRMEHRTNANEQAHSVARNIVGIRNAYCPLPFFWTDQYDNKIQLYGTIHPDSIASFEVGSPGYAKWVLVFRRGDSIDAVLGRNAVKEIMPFRREARRRHLVASVTAQP